MVLHEFFALVFAASSGSYVPELPIGDQESKIPPSVRAEQVKEHFMRLNVDRLEKWVHKYLMRFNKAKHRVLHLCQGNPRYVYKLGD